MNGVGFENQLPWPRIPEDMRLFKTHTFGHAVIMGRRTWDGLPEKHRPLSGRDNIVVTNRELPPTDHPNGTVRFGNLDHIKSVIIPNLQFRNPYADIWVIGGPGLITSMIDIIEEFYITRIDSVFEADTYFDQTLLDGFVRTACSPIESSQGLGLELEVWHNQYPKHPLFDS